MRARLPSWPAFAPALVLVVACAGRGGCAGHGVHRTGSQREAQACTAWASNHCRRLEACAPVSLQAGYGDVETCVARNEVGCDAALRAPGTGATAASIEACAAASGAASCEDVVVGRAPAGCAVSGTLQAGAACGDDSQCAGAGAGGGAGGGPGGGGRGEGGGGGGAGGGGGGRGHGCRAGLLQDGCGRDLRALRDRRSDRRHV